MSLGSYLSVSLRPLRQRVRRFPPRAPKWFLECGLPRDLRSPAEHEHTSRKQKRVEQFLGERGHGTQLSHWCVNLQRPRRWPHSACRPVLALLCGWRPELLEAGGEAERNAHSSNFVLAAAPSASPVHCSNDPAHFSGSVFAAENGSSQTVKFKSESEYDSHVI